ncbi:MAG: oligosaccharide flippase family protein [Sphingopyxis granuli]|uniref:lipopolysaccharide biosynthesis protein n=1 Tax=Sphingopyxis granuli TaxID=267128 RepID=UPI003C76280D
MKNRLAVAIKRLAGNNFLRSVSTLVSAGVAGQAILLAIMPLVTRLYTPADFGVAAVFGALMSTLLMVTSLRYEMAIVLPRSDRQAEILMRLALFLTFVSAAVVLIIVAIWRAPIATMLRVPDLEGLLWALPIALVGAGAYRIFNFWAVRKQAFGLIARTRIWQPLANAAAQLSIGISGSGPLGLIAGQVIGLVVGGKSLSRGARVRTRLDRAEWRRMWSAARQYARFPKFDVPAALVDTLGVQLPNLLLALLFSPAVAGWYMLADRMILTPLSLISQAVGQVVYAKSRDHVMQGSLLVSTAKIAAFLGAGVAAAGLIFVPLAPLLFHYIFGSQWESAGLYAAILFFGFAAQFVYSSISLTLPATNGQHLNLVIHVMLLAGKVLALLYGYMQGSALAAIAAVALAMFIGNVAAIAIILLHLRNCSRAARALARNGRF